MEIVATFRDARSLRRGTVGLVPTMGYLHEGHLALAAEARARCDTVLMSLFVNPLQFGEGEDLAGYPRDLARDAALAADAGVDVLFAPPPEEMYPEPPLTRVSLPTLSTRLEGARRPGHFDGVATVVTKLFAGLLPDEAFFGRKDAQQLAVISRMAADLSFPVAVVGVSTVRDHDGLALSSRNTYLAADERVRARSLNSGLGAAADAVDAGERDAAVLEGLVVAALAAADLEADYVELVDRSTMAHLPRLDRDAFLAVAARVGLPTLIDNVHFDVAADGDVAVDRGRRLPGPSVLSAGDEPDSPDPD